MLDQKIIIQSDVVTKAGHQKIMRLLNRQVMIRWAIRRLPKHFEQVPETYPGTGGYRYRSRDKDYNRQKQRKYGHRKPNVLTGKLRRAVLSRVKIGATQHKGTLTTRGTPAHPLANWQRREIEARSVREFKEDIKWQERQYARLARSDRYRRKRRRRVG